MVICEQESQRTKLRFCNPLSICASTLLILHFPYSSPKSGLGGRGYYRKESWDALLNLSRDLAVGFRESIETHFYCLAEISPMVLHSVYQAAIFFVRLYEESPSPESSRALETTKETLELKNLKWKTAGMCFLLVENLLTGWQEHTCRF